MPSGYHYIKSNPERLQKERDRVKHLNNSRYKDDPEFRTKRIEYAKTYYKNKKNDIKVSAHNDMN